MYSEEKDIIIFYAQKLKSKTGINNKTKN